MPPRRIDPIAARAFAVEVIEKLRQGGHEAVWAGGCVRDQLLDRVPLDYDVATAARPDAVRNIFGRRNTIAIGAAFGVITVVGSKDTGNVEVATFRSDAEYIDGRHPVGVTFCGAREDALRRDFTINGLFFDPTTGSVIDYVGGQNDLNEGVVRAIGDPIMRFEEDHLRILRAIRFSANFEFPIEPETRKAIVVMAGKVESVSPERLAAELRLMFSRHGRGEALRLLVSMNLIGPLFGKRFKRTESFLSSTSDTLDAMEEPNISSAIAVLCYEKPRLAADICHHLRLSNHERKLAVWLIEAVMVLGSSSFSTQQANIPWSVLQPWLAHEWRFQLIDVMKSLAVISLFSTENVDWVWEQVHRDDADLNPPQLLRGNDLMQLGVPSGPAVGKLLGHLRNLQLDGKVTSRELAIKWVEQQCASD